MPGDKKRAKNLARILLFDSCVYGVVAHVLVGEGTHADCVVHLVVSVTFCAKIPSVPQEKPMLGVHGTLAAGGVPVQKLLATALPSVRTQVITCGAVPLLTVAAQVPMRVWVTEPTPQVGVHAE